MSKLLIIADDLTGAVDTGVQLAKRGVPTVVLPDVEDVPEAWQNEVVVMNTESRHATQCAAEEAVTLAVQIGRAHDVEHFYKKTDSTLRGNIGGELQALLRGSGAERLMFVPAFPRLGRTTEGGSQYVNGVELHKTEYAQDPLNPIQTSIVAELIRTQADADIHSVPGQDLASLSGGKDKGIYIFDCGTDGELQEIGSAVSHLGWTSAMAGSAGFADCLADLLGLIRSTRQSPVTLPVRILLVNGSLNPATAQQLLQFEKSGHPVQCIDSLDSQHVDEVVRAIETRSADCLVVSSTDTRSDRTNLPSQNPEAMLRFAENFGQMVAAIIERMDFQLMIVFGGDTLSGIARSLGCKSIVPLTEILPGIALSKMHGSNKEIFVISKAGGFGGEDTLLRLFQEIRRLQQ